MSHEWGRIMRIGFWWESQKEGEPLGRPRRGWGIILKWMGWGGMDWIDLAEDRDQWRALVNTIMNLRVQ
jgi:hypothetical protein